MIERRHRAHQPRRALRAAGTGDQADAAFRQADPAIRRHHAGVAGQRQFEPAAKRRAVHRGDDGLGASSSSPQISPVPISPGG